MYHWAGRTGAWTSLRALWHTAPSATPGLRLICLDVGYRLMVALSWGCLRNWFRQEEQLAKFTPISGRVMYVWVKLLLPCHSCSVYTRYELAPAEGTGFPPADPHLAVFLLGIPWTSHSDGRWIWLSVLSQTVYLCDLQCCTKHSKAL